TATSRPIIVVGRIIPLSLDCFSLTSERVELRAHHGETVGDDTDVVADPVSENHGMAHELSTHFPHLIAQHAELSMHLLAQHAQLSMHFLAQPAGLAAERVFDSRYPLPQVLAEKVDRVRRLEIHFDPAPWAILTSSTAHQD